MGPYLVLGFWPPTEQDVDLNIGLVRRLHPECMFYVGFIFVW